MRHGPPPDDIRDYLAYDPGTGTFTWRVKNHKMQAGEKAGWIHASSGYQRVRFRKRAYQGHPLAYWFMTNTWPSQGQVIDHINRRPGDDRFENLRLATFAQNSANRPGCTAISRFKGVSRIEWDGCVGRWKARIMYKHQAIYLGAFDTEEEAGAAYTKAATQLYGAFASSDHISQPEGIS